MDVTSGLPTVAVFYLAVLNLRPSSPTKLSSPEPAFSTGPPATPHWFQWVWALASVTRIVDIAAACNRVARLLFPFPFICTYLSFVLLYIVFTQASSS